MGVNFDGATSGSPGKDFRYGGMPSASSQPIITQEANGMGPGVTFGSQPSGNREKASPDVPSGGRPGSFVEGNGGMTFQDSTDIVQTDIHFSGDPGAPADIFKGGKSNG